LNFVAAYIPQIRNDDPMPLSLDLSNPKYIYFHGLSRTTIVPSFQSFQSGVFLLHTHISWQSDR